MSADDAILVERDAALTALRTELRVLLDRPTLTTLQEVADRMRAVLSDYPHFALSGASLAEGCRRQPIVARLEVIDVLDQPRGIVIVMASTSNVTLTFHVPGEPAPEEG